MNLPLSRVIFKSSRSDVLEFSSKPIFVELLKENLQNLMLLKGKSCPHPRSCNQLQTRDLPFNFFEDLSVFETLPVCSGFLTLKTEVIIISKASNNDLDEHKSLNDSDEISTLNGSVASFASKQAFVKNFERPTRKCDVASSLLLSKAISRKFSLFQGDYVTVSDCKSGSSCVLRVCVASHDIKLSALSSLSFKLNTHDLSQVNVEVRHQEFFIV